MIDTITKEKLIAEEPENHLIIKPLLRGRDIKKYKFGQSQLWIINTHNGLKSEKLAPIDVEKVFPSIYNFLFADKEKLTSRIDKGDTWANLRSCAYIKEFEKEKIVFTKSSKVQAFAYDNQKHFLLNTSYMLVGEKLKYLLAILNSRLVQFAFKNFYQSGGIEGEITIQAIEQIPIVYPNYSQELELVKLVDEILIGSSKKKQIESNILESQIDQLVYKLYELTDEEIKIVEGNG